MKTNTLNTPKRRQARKNVLELHIRVGEKNVARLEEQLTNARTALARNQAELVQLLAEEGE